MDKYTKDLMVRFLRLSIKSLYIKLKETHSPRLAMEYTKMRHMLAQLGETYHEQHN